MLHSNSLTKESSPYLLQHAQNPVNWQAWSDQLFDIAKQQDKLVLISIGYSTCHWCHVMEHESFENQEVADLMNAHFICVKVDREEHPDVDKVYMNAVQIMTNRGGWPLNCITLPDGRPVYGGTYFPKDQWMHILKSLVHMKGKDHQKMVEYAHQLTEGLNQNREFVSTEDKNQSDYIEILLETVLKWKERLDFELGGLNRAPKFPLPNNLDFQLYHSVYFDDQVLEEYVFTTLNQMAMGGIYDHVEGGFSRYSVDHEWKVPHFEKMLYDNAQLLFTYANAYSVRQNPLYKTIIYQTFDFIESKLKAPTGGYFSAYDADSEGVEGKFYVFTLPELQQILDDEWEEASIIFDFSPASHWEDGNYVIRRNTHLEYVCEVLNLNLEQVEEKALQIAKKLHSYRKDRIYPGLDHKQLTSWNALLLKGMLKCAEVFKDNKFENASKDLYHWINKELITEDDIFRKHTNGISQLSGTLEDYAMLMDSFLSYSVYFTDNDAKDQVEQWITKIDGTFKDSHSSLYFFTPINSPLFYRELDVSDNVIPAANSVIANVFAKLGIINDSLECAEKAKLMLQQVLPDIPHYGSAYSNWAILALDFAFGWKKLKINNEIMEKVRPKHYFLPNVVVTLEPQLKETLLCTMNSCNLIELEREGWIEKSRF